MNEKCYSRRDITGNPIAETSDQESSNQTLEDITEEMGQQSISPLVYSLPLILPFWGKWLDVADFVDFFESGLAYIGAIVGSVLILLTGPPIFPDVKFNLSEFLAQKFLDWWLFSFVDPYSLLL